MELRRAILLFAIVLGLAAVVTAVTRPAQEDEPEPAPSASAPAPAPSAGPQPSGAPLEINLEADLRSEGRSVPVGRAAVLTVVAYEPGQVEIDRLGLNAFAEPDAPARLDLLIERPGRYPVRFIPTETGEARKVGVLEVEG